MRGSFKHRWGTRLFGPIAARILTPPFAWLRWVPIQPAPFRPVAPWPEPDRETAAQLRTTPVWRDAEAEQRAYEQQPLHQVSALWPAAMRWVGRTAWDWLIPAAPALLRSLRRTAAVGLREPALQRSPLDAASLSDALRARARTLGLSTVGFAPYDAKYMFQEASELAQGSVIVCILEQDWEATQTSPSGRCESSVMRTYAEMTRRSSALAEYLQSLGYQAQPHTFVGEGVVIHYAVQAGLGQLGLNGQLLTPQAGSRCRIALVTTDASLVHGEPTDFGIHKVCDACQLCVRRCPTGAIPMRRTEHRGVVKAKIKIDRCLPTVAQAHGCGVCMKVCPVQRYGLDEVKKHFVETGEILGKGTDTLEGYDWIDGRRYGPGEKPRISRAFIKPDGLQIDPTVTRPAAELSGQSAPARGEVLG